MEGLNKGKVNVFRHGEAKYNQFEVDIKEADDLTEKGIETVKNNAKKLADIIGKDEEVVIWSSPLARTIHTAKIIEEVFRDNNISIRGKNEKTINTYPQLIEADNFDWNLWYPLVSGGEVEFNGHKFFIDKNETNPENLNHVEYFAKNKLATLNKNVLDKLPIDYKNKLLSMENFIGTTDRIMNVLSKINNIDLGSYKFSDKSKKYRIIIVTHDGCTGFLANIYDNNKYGIDPGSFISLDKKNDGIFVTDIDLNQIKNPSGDVVSIYKNNKND